ncbi:MAG: glycoside hydrolase family 127 protein [candidate division Zixibacteria bacterium]|nr:glycoside hydrolase family 127 protein [candidate division Zixibacteria bacterium]
MPVTGKTDCDHVLRDTLTSCREQDYAGYGKFDALNSPVLEFLSFDNPWLRLIYIQSVMRCPFHVRPWLGVKKSRNPKGIALFARAYLFLYQRTGQPEYLTEARALLDWLLEHPSPDQKRFCWGYNFIWQELPPFLQWRYAPNIVVTVFVGEALVHAYRVTQDARYLDAACSVAEFITTDLPVQHETAEERAISYLLTETGFIVLNVQVMSAALLAKVWKETGERRLKDIAQKQVAFTINRRTDYNAWYYTHPKGKSPIRHDNYHTGGIVDGILEYCEETGDDRFLSVYWDGLRYYQAHLFEADGAPRWMNDRKYPHDVHGSAQGIISFAKAGRHRPEYHDQARLIADWTITHLYRPKTRDFRYRQGRWMTWDYSLMRWCNAWMTRALAGWALNEHHNSA